MSLDDRPEVPQVIAAARLIQLTARSHTQDTRRITEVQDHRAFRVAQEVPLSWTDVGLPGKYSELLLSLGC